MSLGQREHDFDVSQQHPVPASIIQMDDLKLLILNTKVPNALLFTGNNGAGREESARFIAKSLNCFNRHAQTSGFACNLCRSCLKIDAGMHPDIITLFPEKNVIKTDMIKELCNAIAAKPHEAAIRMVMIIDAHSMNQEAGNAILKRLEEPPERTFFVLTAPDLNLLMPTIISRCRHIRFKPVSVSAVTEDLIKKWAIPEKMAKIAARTSDGNIKKAMMLLNIAAPDNKILSEANIYNPSETKTIKAKRWVQANGEQESNNSPDSANKPVDWIKRRHWLLSRLFLLVKPDRPSDLHHTNPAAKSAVISRYASASNTNLRHLSNKNTLNAMMLAHELSKNEELLEDSILIIKLWLRDIAVVKCIGKSSLSTDLVVNRDFGKHVQYIAQILPSNFSMQSLEAIHTAEKRLESNASVRLILENFFLSLISFCYS
ncbi:putative HolB [Desulfamplus magnetovallimortis]|uniref:Putative HolB n=1 Tax=Desulfamplus magnetovallimortis TaxID=1246637 RepID=A0A1W1HLE1_9BACT|nr:DNA polymerase III subunit delta' [Desulfamplus magnetovallimortis]SLM33273.1 putative HolB [Desulfamplus magnetovallimortis]